MADSKIEVPHLPELHSFTLPTGISAYPTNADNGYRIFPDGKVRIDINISGLTANQYVTIATMPTGLRPTRQVAANACYMGSDGTNMGMSYGYGGQLLNNGNLQVISTGTYVLGIAIEYYP